MANFNHQTDTHQLNCFFEGKLDTVISLDFQPKIEKEIATCQQKMPGDNLKVCFDFKQVDFITSTFIRICVASAKKVGKENFCIGNTNPLIKKTLKIAGLDEQLNVE
jgi:anti-anti-sigma factor